VVTRQFIILLKKGQNGIWFVLFLYSGSSSADRFEKR
jgi:hypothetical protein